MCGTGKCMAPIYWLVRTEFELLRTFSWWELRHQPWRHGVAVVAIALGVALAFAVHLINASALQEFARAVGAMDGQAELEVRAPKGLFDDAVFGQIAAQTDVELALPVLELGTNALSAKGQRVALRVVGVDVLQIAKLAPALLPRLEGDASGLDLLQPNAIFLNDAATAMLMLPPTGNPGLQLQSGLQWKSLQVQGRISTGRTPLAVMDIAAAQDLLGGPGRLSRIDLKLRPGVNQLAWIEKMSANAWWPTGLVLAPPVAKVGQLDSLTRAYRVNLTVLALVALLTGAFLVYAVLSLSVAKRSGAFALLGVLGLTASQRMRLVVLEAAALGVVASGLGLGLGGLIAWAALRFLGGDLGGGYFSGTSTAVHWSLPVAALYAALGVIAAMLAAWWPARLAAQLPLAQSLKGVALTSVARAAGTWRNGFGLGLAITCLALAWWLALLPPVQGLPLAAYASVAALLAGGLALLPWLVNHCVALQARWQSTTQSPGPLRLLSLARAQRMRGAAGVAVGGVMVALCLSVALTVMVASFRASVMQWLNVVLPADLYLRTSNSAQGSETAYFSPEFVLQVGQAPGVRRMAPQRNRALQLDTTKPAVTLVAKTIRNPGSDLPLIGPLGVPPRSTGKGTASGSVAIYVSEAMVSVYGLQPGVTSTLLDLALGLVPSVGTSHFYVAGIVRDYARQGGSVVMGLEDYQRLTGDKLVNDLALWLEPGADLGAMQAHFRALAAQGASRKKGDQGGQGGQLLDFATTAEIRAVSLRIFDRSFAVTYWLQAVAIGIGLFGIAASFAAQVVARCKEFGLLLHLGLTRHQVRSVVAAEGLVWTAVGALGGLVLGLAVAAVLVFVVNPQSFNWSMDLTVPGLRLLGLTLAVVVAGTLTAWWVARLAAGQDAVLAVKDDW